MQFLLDYGPRFAKISLVISKLLSLRLSVLQINGTPLDVDSIYSIFCKFTLCVQHVNAY